MQIQVLFSDDMPGTVDADKLDELIDSRRIVAFRRNTGWVRVGRDTVRGAGGKYNGPERRDSCTAFTKIEEKPTFLGMPEIF